MRVSAILSVLRAHELELRELGVLTLHLLGIAPSPTPGSESVSLAVTLDRTKAPPSIRRFAQRDAVENRLSEILEAKVMMTVEPVSKRGAKPKTGRNRRKVF